MAGLQMDKGLLNMIDITHYFMESIDLRKHPVKQLKEKKRVEYYSALSYIVSHIVDNAVQMDNRNIDSQFREIGTDTYSDVFKKYIACRMELYKKQLLINQIKSSCKNESTNKEALQYVSKCVTRPWRKKYRYWLMSDLALILLDHGMINQAADFIKDYLSTRQKKEFDIFVSYLYDPNANNSKFPFTEDLVKQYHMNETFVKRPLRKFVVTANISAGKSMLINALIGKPLAKTSQEVCTGNLCYMYNKPFEDGFVYLETSELKLDACSYDLQNYSWHGAVSISSYFTDVSTQTSPICIIDTPGVNAALHREHSKIAHQALNSQHYDKLLYVINPTNLGTDAEFKHIKWVSDHIAKDKVIFVLNKLDDYRSNADDIGGSIEVLHKELIKLGFEKPIICPISAYFGLLLKMKLTGQKFTEDEQDEYIRLAKKFSRPQYDLSHYYEEVQCLDSDAEEIKLCKKSGIYGLEKLFMEEAYEEGIH